MPQETRWYIPNRILLIHAYGIITDEDLEQEAANITRYFAERDEAVQAGAFPAKLPLHLLFDSTELIQVKGSIQSSIKIAQAAHKHPDFRWSAIFGSKQNRFVGLLSAVTAQMLNIRTRQFETYAEAFAFLQEIDETLDFEGLPAPLRITT